MRLLCFTFYASLWGSLISVLVLGPLSLCAETEPSAVTAIIEGKITDTKGKPITGAIVTTDPTTTQVVSRADGSYTLPDVPGGTYWVQAKAGNKQIGMTRVHVVTATSNAVPGIQIRLQGAETFQEQWQRRRSAVFTSLALFPAGTFLGLSIAGNSFSDSTDEAREKFDLTFPTTPADYLIRGDLWEEYQKRQTREDWMRVTSLNLLADALPFYFYSVREKRVSNRLLILYYGSQAVIFGTWAAIDWDASREASELSEVYSERIQFHEATRQRGKKARLQERAQWLAINAALDVAIGYLYWRITPRQTNRRYANLRLGPQLAENQVGISVSATFR